MAGLKVYSAPSNQPTLNPVVQKAPIQPTLAPRVVTQPQQPQLAPQVVTRPVQPVFNPVVQNQPAGQQASLPIQYTPIVTSIIEAQKRGAPPDLILQKIIEGNPDKQEAINTALSRGANASDVLDEIIRQNYAPSTDTSQEKQPGLFQSIVQGIASPFIKASKAVASLDPAIRSKFEDDPQKKYELEKRAFEVAAGTTDAGYFGKVGPIGTIGDNSLKSQLKPIGIGLQIGSTFAGNPVIGGAAYGGGNALAEGKSGADVVKDTVVGGVLGYGSKLLGTGLTKIAKPLSNVAQESAEATYSQALGATTKANKQLSEKVVPELIQRGERAMTRGGLLQKAEQGLQKAGDALEEAYNKLPAGTRVNVKPVFDDLQKIKQQYVIKGTTQIGDDVAYKAVENMQRKLLEISNESVSVESIRSFRQILDKATNRAGKSFALTDSDTVVAEARKATANAIRKELAAEFPEIAKINKEFTFWSNVQKVVGDTILRTKSQNSLGGQLAAEGGAVIGATMKGTAGGVILGAATLKTLREAIQSTAWRTTSAIAKANIADLLAKGDIAKAGTVLQKIISASRSQRTE